MRPLWMVIGSEAAFVKDGFWTELYEAEMFCLCKADVASNCARTCMFEFHKILYF